jgi:hypothetical protein
MPIKILQIILNNWRLFAFIGGITLSGLVAYNQGIQSAKSLCDAEKVQIQLATAAKEKELHEKVYLIQKELDDVQASNAIEYDNYTNWLRKQDDSSLHKYNSTTRTNASACGKKPTTQDKIAIVKIVQNCDDTIERFIALQKFVMEVYK